VFYNIHYRGQEEISFANICSRYRSAVKNIYRETPFGEIRSNVTCMRFDCTPSNSLLRSAAESFALSGTSIFIVLRDPLDRMRSQFVMHSNLDKNLCMMAKPDKGLVFRQTLLDNLKKYWRVSVDDGGWQHGFGDIPSLDDEPNVFEYIDRSLYDRILHLYRKVDLDVLFFEDVVTCSETLFETLSNHLPHWVNKVAALKCMRRQCVANKLKPPDTFYKNCTNVDIADIPAEVANFVRANNKFYYSNNPYLRTTM